MDRFIPGSTLKDRGLSAVNLAMDMMVLTILLGSIFSDDLQVIDLKQFARKANSSQNTQENRWEHQTLQCRYNPLGATVNLDVVEQAIIEAGKAWELKSGLEFIYSGTTDETPGSVVYDCLISWDLFPDIFKLGQARNFRIGTELVGSDIRISKLLNESHLAMVLTHEIGHSLGLGHDSNGCIMQSSPEDGRLCFSDYARVSRLYPPYEIDGTPGLDCTVNILPGNEIYIPSIDGKYWARYRLNADLSMSHIEHGRITEPDMFLCRKH